LGAVLLSRPRSVAATVRMRTRTAASQSAARWVLDREEVMMASKVKDVMTSQVVCVRPSTTYKELVRLLTE
jgi:CBS-domain-containing membrane protein